MYACMYMQWYSKQHYTTLQTEIPERGRETKKGIVEGNEPCGNQHVCYASTAKQGNVSVEIWLGDMDGTMQVIRGLSEHLNHLNLPLQRGDRSAYSVGM